MQEPGLRGVVGMVPSVQFIDVEYSGYAPRGFDWGNHFAEYAGFECAYERYPGAAHAANFVRAYLAEGAQNLPVRPRRSCCSYRIHCAAMAGHGGLCWGHSRVAGSALCKCLGSAELEAGLHVDW